MDHKIKIMLTTTSDRDVAENIAGWLVRNNLASCVQISDKITSYYKWESKIEKTTELLVLIKTTDKKVEKVKKIISDIHNYKVPELIEIDSTILNEKYAEWFFINLR